MFVQIEHRDGTRICVLVSAGRIPHCKRDHRPDGRGAAWGPVLLCRERGEAHDQTRPAKLGFKSPDPETSSTNALIPFCARDTLLENCGSALLSDLYLPPDKGMKQISYVLHIWRQQSIQEYHPNLQVNQRTAEPLRRLPSPLGQDLGVLAISVALPWQMKHPRYGPRNWEGQTDKMLLINARMISIFSYNKRLKNFQATDRWTWPYAPPPSPPCSDEFLCL